MYVSALFYLNDTLLLSLMRSFTPAVDITRLDLTVGGPLSPGSFRRASAVISPVKPKFGPVL